MIGQIIVAVLVGAILGGVGGVFALDARHDARYVSAAKFDSFYDGYKFDQHMKWRREVRILKNKLEDEPGNPYLKDDLETYLDKLCSEVPGDRLC